MVYCPQDTCAASQMKGRWNRLRLSNFSSDVLHFPHLSTVRNVEHEVQSTLPATTPHCHACYRGCFPKPRLMLSQKQCRTTPILRSEQNLSLILGHSVVLPLIPLNILARIADVEDRGRIPLVWGSEDSSDQVLGIAVHNGS